MSSVVPNPQLLHLPVYVPGRPIDEVARQHGLDPGQVIKLASNENPLGPSPKALSAIADVLKNLNLYPDGSGFYFKQKLAESLGVEVSNLILGNGSNEILEFVGHGFLSPGDEVVVSQYCFAVYPIVTALFGASLVNVPACEFGHDIRSMLRAVTSRTKVMFVANPNNPTGTLISREDISLLLAELPSHVLLALDEAYIEFLEDPVDCVPLIRSGAMPNLLLMRTFSKVYGLAGLRLGFGVGVPGIISTLEKVRQPFNINSMAQAGAIAALDDIEHLAKTRRNNRSGIQFFQSAFETLGLQYVTSHANFVLVRVGDGKTVFQELQKRGVITRPMASYQLEEWIRISIGTPVENSRCLNVLREILAGTSLS